MSAYFVATYDVTDPDAYADYRRQVVPLLHKHSGEIVIADYQPKVIEGEQRGVTVVLKFESEEAAMNWYNDPEYRPVMQLRLDTTANMTGHLVKGFVMPTE